MTVTVSFNPLLFVNNLITITDEYYGLQRARFLIQSISYTLGDQCEMTLTCSNIANFSDLTLISIEKPKVSNILDAILDAPFEN